MLQGLIKLPTQFGDNCLIFCVLIGVGADKRASLWVLRDDKCERFMKKVACLHFSRVHVRHILL